MSISVSVVIEVSVAMVLGVYFEVNGGGGDAGGEVIVTV